MEIDIVTKKDLQQFKLELLQELKQLISNNSQPNAKWLRSGEVRKMLKISPGTLQNLRVSGALRSTKLGGMHYYKNEDIQNILNGNENGPR